MVSSVRDAKIYAVVQLFVTIGILAAGLINYGADYIPNWGWRLSLGLAGKPYIKLSTL